MPCCIVEQTVSCLPQALNWAQLQTPSRGPSGRELHVAAMDDKGRMLIFGGLHGAVVDEVWLLEAAALCLDGG